MPYANLLFVVRIWLYFRAFLVWSALQHFYKFGFFFQIECNKHHWDAFNVDMRIWSVSVILSYRPLQNWKHLGMSIRTNIYIKFNISSFFLHKMEQDGEKCNLGHLTLLLSLAYLSVLIWLTSFELTCRWLLCNICCC